MNIQENQNWISRYQSVITFVLLGIQYIFISLFPNSFSKVTETSYALLLVYDLLFAIPILVIIHMPLKNRRLLLGAILALSFIYFWPKFRWNTVFLNTFIALLISSRYLFFDLSKRDKDQISRLKIQQFFIFFGVLMLATIVESILEWTGLVKHKSLDDGLEFSKGGVIMIFSGYYFCVAYFEFRAIQNCLREQTVDET